MTTQQILNLIQQRSQANSILVLRGFDCEVLRLMRTKMLDKDAIASNGVLDLSKISGQEVLNKLIQANEAIMTMESMIALSTSFSSLDILGKKFCIINNNLLSSFRNPTNSDIPDFESSNFQNEDDGHYCKFYSYCEELDGYQMLNYNEPDFSGSRCVSKIDLIEPTSLEGITEYPNNDKIETLSSDSGSLQKLMCRIYYDKIESTESYALSRVSIDKDTYGVLLAIIKLCQLPIKLYWQQSKRIEVRKDLQALLQSVWGYSEFRQLKMYKDLEVNRDVTLISQGEIIETVVRESENAYNKKDFHNVLLTSPTGAGKSLLFQLSAIYLAEKYGLLTIVVSPLLALMEDQVKNLCSKYEKVATLNSNKTAEESKSIIARTQSGDINILYLAPELLLSHSLQSLIGERKVGLVVIDEAHTVTTWGRDFRVDYWFLGDYLRSSKKYMKQQFPIFALTATAVWDVTGKNDTVNETVNSLNMAPCVKFIGVVRRDNIIFEIGRPERVRDYEKQRRLRTVECINQAVEKERKTIVYFPFIRTISQVLEEEGIQKNRRLITEFHSQLSPIEKQTNAAFFKSGECPIMCASKAFGMGIDVPDITEVYHHAPTGNLSDYVQEIGRLARDEKLYGIAKIDFNEQDFKYTKQLHGISTIKMHQLESVLKKLMELYFLGGEKRNMMISPSDFEYIFPNADDIDQKLKTSLLLIANDLRRKLSFRALIVRAKNMFVDVFIQLPTNEARGFYSQYKDYLSPIGLVDDGRFKLSAERYWNDYMSKISFAQFKSKLALRQVFKNYHVELINKLDIALNKNVELTRTQLVRFFNDAEAVLNKLARATANEPRHIKFHELKSRLKDYSDVQKEAFLHTFVLAYTKTGKNAGYCQVKVTGDEEANSQISIIQHGYEIVKCQVLDMFDKFIHRETTSLFCLPDDKVVRLAEILDSLGIASFQRVGGCDPQVFVRVNNPDYLNGLLRRGNYRNRMLEDVYEKYEISQRLFTYFFNTDMTNEERWDFIENYFLGQSVEELCKKR